MLLTEYDEARARELFREEGREEGIEEGRKEGEDKLAKLMDRLFSLNRFEDARRAATDIAYRALLYLEFELTQARHRAPQRQGDTHDTGHLSAQAAQ